MHHSSKQFTRQTQFDAAQRKAAQDTAYFWELVHMRKVARAPKKVTMQEQEQLLFGSRLQTSSVQQQSDRTPNEGDDKGTDPPDNSVGIGHHGTPSGLTGLDDDNIPVQRSGPHSDEFPILDSFADFADVVPSFLNDNVRRMGYAKPTAIQKHAIPVGLRGEDLMCCAQTGSGKTFAFLVPVITSIHAIYKLTDEELSKNYAKDKDGETSTSTSPHPGVVVATATADGENATDAAVVDAEEEETVADRTDEKLATVVDSSSNQNQRSHITMRKGIPSAASPALTTAGTGTIVGATRLLRERLCIDNRGALPLAIILAPTRELAGQIHLDVRRLIFGSHLKAVCVYGGSDLRLQLSELSTGCDIIIATPGRLNDLVDRGCVSLSQVALLVLDEADRMLDMGFEPQIRRVILDSDMPRREQRQTFMFSATFPAEIQTMASEFLRDYIWVAVGRVGSAVDGIEQRLFQATSDNYNKLELLSEALSVTGGRTLVFVQKRRTASWLCQTLNTREQVPIALEIHGDRTQAQREGALKQFRDGHVRILVATDVAARGLDIPDVTHVIQFDMPISPDDFDVYIHRIGRTGRAGQKGVATSFYVPGREIGEGNGKCAQILLKTLQESKQQVPPWFAACEDLKFTNNNSAGGGGYNNRSNGRYAGRGGYESGYGGRGGSNQQSNGYYNNKGSNNRDSNNSNMYGNAQPYYYNTQGRGGGGGGHGGHGRYVSSGAYGPGRGFDWGDVRDNQHSTTTYGGGGGHDRSSLSGGRPLQHQLPAQMMFYQQEMHIEHPLVQQQPQPMYGNMMAARSLRETNAPPPQHMHHGRGYSGTAGGGVTGQVYPYSPTGQLPHPAEGYQTQSHQYQFPVPPQAPVYHSYQEQGGSAAARVVPTGVDGSGVAVRYTSQASPISMTPFPQFAQMNSYPPHQYQMQYQHQLHTQQQLQYQQPDPSYGV